MKNLLSYLKEYGRVSFEEEPLNELDIALFSQLPYMDFNSISFDQDIKYSLKSLLKLYFVDRDKKDRYLGLIIPRDIVPAIRKMSNCTRYKNIKVYNYLNKINLEKEEQFSAITIDIDKATKLIIYGGTDDHIVGWKEDFNSLYLPTTLSQKDAYKYLLDSGNQDKRKMYVLGHSKGGNLAMYASINAPQEIQDRIINVYNFDGQGFLSINSNKKFDEIYARIISLCPRGSLIGRLFHHTEEAHIVNSYGVALFQHDIYTWEVKGTKFIYLEHFDEISDKLDLLINGLIKELTITEKQNFVQAFFDYLNITATTLTELIKKPFSIITSYIMLKAESKAHLKRVAKVFLASKDFKKMMFDTYGELRRILKEDQKKAK
ncbi:MAG: DUF2974 domain-containing protein [Clostridia bacterium]|nr:DUF2974 domain-containing protein [Clostridia bacterium]